MPRSNLLSLFDDFHRYSRDIAVVQRRGYRRESSTYAKLAKIAFRLEHDLRQHGVRTGDRVLLWSPNSAEWMAAFWGCLLRGAVAVPIDDGATFDFAARVARETSAKLIIASEGKPSPDAAIPTLNLEDLADTNPLPTNPLPATTSRKSSSPPAPPPSPAASSSRTAISWRILSLSSAASTRTASTSAGGTRFVSSRSCRSVMSSGSS